MILINAFKGPSFLKATFLEIRAIPPPFRYETNCSVELVLLYMIAFANFKHTWIRIHARAAGVQPAAF
jgi:hypothetical protein